MAFQNGRFVIDCCLVGLVGVSFDVLWLDAVLSLVVALLIAKIALGLLWDSMQELIDTALPEDQMMAIRAIAMNVPGLRDVHQCELERWPERS